MDPKNLIYIRAKSLEFYKQGTEGALKLDLPETVIKDQEVINPGLLEKTVSDFVKSSKIVPGVAAVVLAEEVTYKKAIPSTDAKDEKFETDKFLADIPFDPPNIEVRTTRTETDLSLYAANKHFFYPIVRILQKSGWITVSVVPVVAFDNNLEKIYADKKITPTVNFLAEEELQQQEKKRRWAISPKAIILAIVWGVLLLVLGFLLWNQKKTMSSQTPTRIATSSAESIVMPVKVKYKEKADLKIKILNGTGTAGDAGKVVAALKKLDYQNMETGNLEEQKNATTSAEFRETVNPEFSAQIMSALKDLFTKVASSSASPSASFDVVIITGK